MPTFNVSRIMHLTLRTILIVMGYSVTSLVKVLFCLGSSPIAGSKDKGALKHLGRRPQYTAGDKAWSISS